MAIDARPLLERAGVAAALGEEMIEILAAANEDPDGLLLHSPYVVHEMRPPT